MALGKVYTLPPSDYFNYSIGVGAPKKQLETPDQVSKMRSINMPHCFEQQKSLWQMNEENYLEKPDYVKKEA